MAFPLPVISDSGKKETRVWNSNKFIQSLRVVQLPKKRQAGSAVTTRPQQRMMPAWRQWWEYDSIYDLAYPCEQEKKGLV